jgi:hypothetical protein
VIDGYEAEGNRRKQWQNMITGMKKQQRTLPMMTESTMDGGTFPEAKAALAATVANSVADRLLSDPPKAPHGVRLAATT